jgi:hypothetical protein
MIYWEEQRAYEEHLAEQAELEWWFRLGRINISKRQFMIINGLGPEDMKNDIIYP